MTLLLTKEHNDKPKKDDFVTSQHKKQIPVGNVSSAISQKLLLCGGGENVYQV